MGFSSAPVFPEMKREAVTQGICLGVWVQLLGVQGGPACVILVLRECIWNAPEVSLVVPAFDDTSSLGSPPTQVVYPRLNGSTMDDCLPFPCREYGS